jgi:uncharacterized DUF497 family protein
VEITWDDRKAEANFKKHDVDFDEAATVVLNPLALMAPNAHHDGSRWEYLGHSRGAFSTLSQLKRMMNVRESSQPERRKIMKKKDTKKGFNFDKAQFNKKALNRDLKISKTFRIDADVFLWLQEESDRTGISYQTLMNAKLREAKNLPDRVRALVEEVLASKKAS